MNFDSLKDKYNYYRNMTDYRLLPNSYVMVMLDGRSFSHKIKKRFKRPFDDEFIRIMNETAQYVAKNISGCKLAYVQSDEINLVLYDKSTQEPFFGNRMCKLLSIIASMASGKFNQLMFEYNIRQMSYDNTKMDCEDTLYSIKDAMAAMSSMPLYEFDCKVWNVPNVNDAFAGILYRQNDCIRNSKEAVAQDKFSADELHKKRTDEQIVMVREKFGIDWYTDFDDGKKYGRFIIPQLVTFSENCKRRKWTINNAFPLSDENNRKELMLYLTDDEEVSD